MTVDLGIQREALVQMVESDRDILDRDLYEESLAVLARVSGCSIEALAFEIEREAWDRVQASPEGWS